MSNSMFCCLDEILLGLQTIAGRASHLSEVEVELE